MSALGLRSNAIPVSSDASIAIDFWAPSASRNIRAYFLTHAHADHVVGLGARRWSPETLGARIYCDEITREILVSKWPTLGRHVKALERNRGHGVRLTRETTIEVTLIDAGHCPGSVVVCVEGPNGRLVHTGDFRREDWIAREALPRAMTRAPVDYLFLDNTYCHPKHAFPGRAEATEDIVRFCVSNPGRAIVLGIDSLGKEDLVIAVSEAIGAPVEIPDERFLPSSYTRFLTGHRACERENFIRRSMNESLDVTRRTHVRCVPKQHVRPSTLRALVKGLRHDDAPPLAILPTGWSAIERQRGEGAGVSGPSEHDPIDSVVEFDDEAGRIVAVPYSLHAPYDELEAFVRALRPACVFGNTRVDADAEAPRDPAVWFESLCSQKDTQLKLAAYQEDLERAMHLDEPIGDVVIEDAVLKSRVNIDDVTVIAPHVPEKPAVRLVAAECGMYFEPPRKMTWRDREAARAAEFFASAQRVLGIITPTMKTSKRKLVAANDENAVNDWKTMKKRGFVPPFMQQN
ncbi:Beta-lactamase-like [Ostreococcus tauri]|uniref:Protein artemis n=1 Tax=Ostreococcus tauri TaxID=70448 RepID=Q016H0_OSTTA|nr:Beta-lactamase-like [Ostreococcus tauri]CAL53691.1 Beta-lactamase-like [Ostreococcus tauri]|eukprot:XP_003080043.1 Beta-lactamase-like [Ostreococcus tauri]